MWPTFHLSLHFCGYIFSRVSTRVALFLMIRPAAGNNKASTILPPAEYLTHRGELLSMRKACRCVCFCRGRAPCKNVMPAASTREWDVLLLSVYLQCLYIALYPASPVCLLSCSFTFGPSRVYLQQRLSRHRRQQRERLRVLRRPVRVVRRRRVRVGGGLRQHQLLRQRRPRKPGRLLRKRLGPLRHRRRR